MDLLSRASWAWVLSLTFPFVAEAKADQYWPHCETSGLNVIETHYNEFQEVHWQFPWDTCTDKGKAVGLKM